MKSALLVIAGLWAGLEAQHFLNHRPFPTYSLENMPDTGFSCRDKILGGYYADVETECQMFHICVKVAGVGIQDFRFLCPNGTAFDQDHQICAEWEDVDCDVSTLYYSSDNFDLYRIGSGFESKAVKYGEDEETFALQRAETGDVRLNREHQTQRVNQQKKQQRKNRPQNNEKDIFKGSSSSNFFNNRNGGKETEDDDDDNVNVNQNNDQFQRRKVARKQHRRPVQNNDQQYRQPQSDHQNNNRRPVQNNQQNNDQQYRQPQSDYQNNNRRPVQQNRNRQQQRPREEAQPSRPTGFANNFAGSSYVPTTSRPTSPVNNADKLRPSSNSPSPPPPPTFTVSTPAPFKQTQQYNSPPSRPTPQNNEQYNPTSAAPQRETENYPSNFPRQTQRPALKQTEISNNYDTPRVKSTPSNHYDVPKVKPTTPLKQQDYPTTFAPKYNKPSSYPSTFSPRTNSGYSQISQQTTQYKSQPVEQQRSTPKPTTFTQYTPTVPKISSTTPVARSNRFDETQYDDGSYDPKYDRADDEFLKTAHSQNIASSRNEYLQSTKNTQPPTQKPRPFSVSPTTSRVTESKPAETKKEVPSPKKVKDVSYDYAYYDTNVGSEPEYDIDTEIKKATKN